MGNKGNDPNQDNYLDMYLSQTYANTSNYMIFKSDSFVSINCLVDNKCLLSVEGEPQRVQLACAEDPKECRYDGVSHQVRLQRVRVRDRILHRQEGLKAIVRPTLKTYNLAPWLLATLP
jgi:hypothetical protein